MRAGWRLLRIIRVWLLCLIAPAAAFAQAPEAPFPNKTIWIVVPFPPGGPTDIFARVLADRMQVILGQPVLVDNRPGATGMTGTAAVSRAAPDGYTLLFSSNSSHVLAPLLRNPPPYHPINDFKPISILLHYPFALIVHSKLGVKTTAEFVKHAHANPGKLNLGIFGRGSGGHLVSEMFNYQAKVNATQIPYRGVAGLHQALIAGEIDYIFDSFGSSRHLMDAGHVRILGVTGSKRLSHAPDVPTMEEAGLLKGFEAVIWLGLMAPAKTPDPIIAKLNAAVKAAAQTPEVRGRIDQFASVLVANSPEEFVQVMRMEQGVWGEFIRAHDIKAE